MCNPEQTMGVYSLWRRAGVVSRLYWLKYPNEKKMYFSSVGIIATILVWYHTVRTQNGLSPCAQIRRRLFRFGQTNTQACELQDTDRSGEDLDYFYRGGGVTSEFFSVGSNFINMYSLNYVYLVNVIDLTFLPSRHMSITFTEGCKYHQEFYTCFNC